MSLVIHKSLAGSHFALLTTVAVAERSSEVLKNSLSDLIGAHLSSKIRGDESSANSIINGVVDGGGRLGVAHKLEHERGGTNGGDGVGDGGDTVGDIGCGTVDRLAY